MIRGLAACSLAALTSACVSVLPEPPSPPRIYTLAAAIAPVSQSTPAPIVIAVAPPNGPRALMGAELVWRRDGVLAFVEATQWAGRSPDLLQALMVDTFIAQGAVRAAVRTGAGVRADYEVQWDLSAFEVREEGGGLEAVIAGHARLVDSRSREILVATPFAAREPLSSRSAGVAAAALERAARDAAQDVARRMAGEAAAAQARAASINK